MNILHISNGFANSKVHSNLTAALDKMGVEQTVYCPVREEQLLGRNQFEGKHIHFVYSLCIKSWYKYVYHIKKWMLYRDLRKRIDLNSFDIVHAGTLFSDGGLALMVYKRYGIPYIVAVRNTDINFYIRKLVHTHKVGREILLNASKIVFISKSEMNEFLDSHFVDPIIDKIKSKILVQPNGIDDYWIEHISNEKRIGQNVLYIGDYSANKNVIRLIEAVKKLRKEEGFENVCLKIVGGEKIGNVWNNDDITKKVINDNSDFVEPLGKIYDKDKLSEVMHSCALFAMPSILETFGLVYLEALSQNLPVIYTKGQGIDGMFDNSVGIAVDALSVDDISRAIREMMLHPDHYTNRNIDFGEFRWDEIAKRYKSMYDIYLK